MVKLIALSQPYVGGCTNAEELIAYCARVSNPENQENKQTADRLVRYLIKNQHWSPFEMISMTLEIETTRDIARQILRHRSFSFQEFSQRYAEATEWSEPREVRKQDKTNRQNSYEIDDEDLKEWWWSVQNEIIHPIQKRYSEALAFGIAKEVARAILPEGMILTKMYMSGTLRSWIHYYQLRSGNGTQKEHRLIAEQVGEIIKDKFPNVWKALDINNNG